MPQWKSWTTGESHPHYLLKPEGALVSSSYYVLDGTKKRVTFDDNDENETGENGTETTANENEEVAEEENGEEEEVEEDDEPVRIQSNTSSQKALFYTLGQ